MTEMRFLVINMLLASIVGMSGLVGEHGILVILSGLHLYGSVFHYIINRSNDED